MRIKILLLLLTVAHLSFAQQFHNEVIELAKIYRGFHFRNDPTEEVSARLQAITSPQLTVAKKVVSELVKTNNQITSKEYLTKPDSATLKNLYIVRALNWRMHEAEPQDPAFVIDSLQKEQTDYYELLACYYGMIFTSVGNKNKPFDMSGVNFTPGAYNLQDDTEKGIFFLESMSLFGTLIWGYMNIPKPPNYKLALEYISKYPKYNGQPYYQYLDLNFKDFKLTTDKRKPKESFKKYYINKYMNTLLYHALCLSQKKKDEGKRRDVLLGSILPNESYWHYSESPELLQSVFHKVKG